MSNQSDQPAATDDQRPRESGVDVAGYVAAVAARQPAPGGGSVLGVTAALAAGLGSMVCRFSAPATAETDVPPELVPVLAELDRLREEALRLAAADEDAYVPALEAAGYVLRIREPDWHEHRVFKGSDINLNLHVWSFGNPEIARHIRVRDWLRHHDDDRDFYAAGKRRIASGPLSSW